MGEARDSTGHAAAFRAFRVFELHWHFHHHLNTTGQRSITPSISSSPISTTTSVFSTAIDDGDNLNASPPPDRYSFPSLVVDVTMIDV